MSAGTGLAVDLVVGDLPALPAAVEVAAFRIATEAVANVVRHAGATTCQVSVARSDGRLEVRVTDDGRGIGSGDHPGHGLHTMRERAEELRGRFSVASGPGTTVVAELPLAPWPRTALATP